MPALSRRAAPLALLAALSAAPALAQNATQGAQARQAQHERMMQALEAATTRLDAAAARLEAQADAGAAPAQGAAQQAECRGQLTAQGVGAVAAIPDILRMSFDAQAQAENPGEALSQASSQTQAVLEAIAAAGVAKKDVATSAVSLRPVYDRSDRQAPTIEGWQAASSLNVTLRDISLFGQLASAATEAGATGLSGVSFDVSDREARLEEARDEAVKAALARAQRLADAAGASLGAILELSEAGNMGGPRPMFARAAAMESADMPIAEGEQSLEASVTLTVELCQ